MGRTIYTPKNEERAVYVGRFRGYRMLAFDKMQILDYEAEIEVYQLHQRPALWAAKDLAGRFRSSAFVSPRAEDILSALVHEAVHRIASRRSGKSSESGAAPERKVKFDLRLVGETGLTGSSWWPLILHIRHAAKESVLRRSSPHTIGDRTEGSRGGNGARRRQQ